MEILEVDCMSAPEALLRELYEAELDALGELQGAEPAPSFEERQRRLRAGSARRSFASCARPQSQTA